MLICLIYVYPTIFSYEINTYTFNMTRYIFLFNERSCNLNNILTYKSKCLVYGKEVTFGNNVMIIFQYAMIFQINIKV